MVPALVHGHNDRHRMNKFASLAAAISVLAALACGRVMAQDVVPPAAAESDLPFKRTFAASGIVSGSLEESALAAGVPAPALVELLRGVAEAIDLDHDVRDGDRFYVRYERTFSLEDAPIDGGRVLWAELQLSAKKSTIALHRFRPFGAPHESFWLASGQGATPSELRFPLPSFVVSSGFGLRVDPLDQPPVFALGAGPALGQPLGKGPTRAGVLPPGLGSGSGLLSPVNMATPLALAPGAWAPRVTTAPGAPRALRALGGSVGGVMALHEGVDLVAPYGTPIHAAGDGVVKGAEPKGRYGNWIEIDHAGDLATVYGHLASFAPGIAPGKQVSQGDVIGYIGLTGRTTGAHVHFEVRFKDRPVNPMVYSALKHPQLRGRDFDHFRKLVARDLADRDREAKVASAGL
jgi:murein DD-endopeptidase MepM/ murein hydrolase activator NlpD